MSEILKKSTRREFLGSRQKTPVIETSPGQTPNVPVNEFLEKIDDFRRTTKEVNGDFPNLPRPPEPAPRAVAPEQVDQPRVEPEPRPVETSAEREKPKTFKEVLALQQEFFSARREMVAFRKGNKVDDLKKSDRENYFELRDKQYYLRQMWLEDVASLPQKQQDELKGIKKFKDVEARIASLPAEEIAPAVERDLVAEMKEQSRLTELSLEQLRASGEFAERQISGDSRVNEDVRELKKQGRDLEARVSAIEGRMVQTAPTSERAPTPHRVVSAERPRPSLEAVPATLSDSQRAQAESKSRILELRRTAMNEVDKRMMQMAVAYSKTKLWEVMDRMKIRGEMRALTKERQRLDREMNERPGFGEKFKEVAGKAYRSAKSKLKLEREKPITLGLIEYEAAKPEDIERVEREAEDATEAKEDSKGSTWKFIKQRLGGLVTGGYQEYKPAEKFRTGTKEVGRDVASLSRLIQKERDLSVDDAQDVANEIVAKMEAEGKETSGDPRFLELSAEITERRITENDAKIDEIIIAEIDQLEKRLKGYKSDHGQAILTEENKNKIAAEMRVRLVALRSGKGEADVKELTKMLRKGLDKDWWWRYVYGGIDSILAGIAIKWIGGKFLAGKVVAGKGIASKEALTVGLKDTIWAEAKRDLIAHGIPNPTDPQTLKLALKYCVDSGVKVAGWPETAAGKVMDTALAKGFAIYKAGGLKLIPGMIAKIVAIA
jgi:hypothetical protein